MSGECQECSKKKRLGLQTKLKVNEPGDIYEQEADRVADQVVAAPGQHAVSGARLRIQRFSGEAHGQLAAAPASVDQALASPSRPLEPTLRQHMEQRFGYDFSGVRVHTGTAAVQSARDVNAHAYTVGTEIVFGAHKFAPENREGRGLLVHELTHVVQQEGASALRLFRQPDLTGSGLILPTPEPRSLRGTLDVGNLHTDEMDLEIALIQQWLDVHAQDPRVDHLRSELKRLKSALKIKLEPFMLRFIWAWDEAKGAAWKDISDKDSIGRGLMNVGLEDLAVSAEEIWKHGIAGGRFLEGERPLVDEWAHAWAEKTYAKRYKEAKFGHSYGDEAAYGGELSRRRLDTEIWKRGVAYHLFLPGEKARVLRIPFLSVAKADALNQRISAVDPRSLQAAWLIDQIHDFTRDPGVVLLGPEVEKFLGRYGYTYSGDVEAPFVARAINTAYEKYLPKRQIRTSGASVQWRWDECMRRRSLDVNNLEAAEFDPDCFHSEAEFAQEVVRRFNEFKARYEACGHSRPSHFDCMKEVGAEYFPAWQARRDAIWAWVQGEMEIYEGVVGGGVVSQVGFHFAHDVLGWSSQDSAAFSVLLSAGTMFTGAAIRRHVILKTSPSNPSPPPAPTGVVVGQPEPMPKPGGPVALEASLKPLVAARPATVRPALPAANVTTSPPISNVPSGPLEANLAPSALGQPIVSVRSDPGTTIQWSEAMERAMQVASEERFGQSNVDRRGKQLGPGVWKAKKLAKIRSRTISVTDEQLGTGAVGATPKPKWAHPSAKLEATDQKTVGRHLDALETAGLASGKRLREDPPRSMHVEVQRFAQDPQTPRVAVSNPVCYSCVAFLKDEARFQGRTLYAEDPITVWEFSPNGVVTSHERDGTTVVFDQSWNPLQWGQKSRGH